MFLQKNVWLIVHSTCLAPRIENPPTTGAVTTALTFGSFLTDTVMEISMNLFLVAMLSGSTFESNTKLNKFSGGCGKSKQ